MSVPETPETAAARLDLARENLYLAFQSYQRPKQLDMSPLEDRSQIERALKAVPLREIDAEDLGRYASSALYTVGDETDYRYFLPRLLDLAAAEDQVHTGLEAWNIAHHLHYGKWGAWPKSEQQAVVQFYSAAFYTSAYHDPVEIEAGSWLVGLAKLGLPINVHVRVWHGGSTPAAFKQCAATVGMIASALMEKQYSLLDDVSEPNLHDLSTWIRTEETRQLLLAGLQVVTNDETWWFHAALGALDAFP